MTDIAITARAAVGPRSFLSAIRDHLAALAAGAQDGRDIECRYRALSCMTSSELTAQGLTRSDIARAALTGSSSKVSGA